MHIIYIHKINPINDQLKLTFCAAGLSRSRLSARRSAGASNSSREGTAVLIMMESVSP